MTDNEILSIRFKCKDLNREMTIREYLCELLLAVWKQGEGFSGKRPFGNSGWDFELFKPLIVHGLVRGELTDDEDQYIEVFPRKEREKAHALIARLIVAMCAGVSK